VYIVVCANTNTIDMSSFKPFEINDSVFGPFSIKEHAEEWVDDNCGKQYWTIIKLNNGSNT
jgi:hypothetical protein